MTNGYFGIGVENLKREYNLGTLWRSASALGASFEDFYTNLPHSCQLVGVELHQEATPISDFKHPMRCAYLLGAEDSGLSVEALKRCHKLVKLPGTSYLNVAVAGSLVMFARISKG